MTNIDQTLSKRAAAMSAVLVALFVLGACSEESSNDKGSAGAAVEMGQSGSYATASGAMGSEVTGSGGAGPEVTGSGGAGPMVGSVGDGSATAGSPAAGSGASGSGVAGSATAGAPAAGSDAAGSDAVTDAEVPDANTSGKRAPAVSFSFPMVSEYTEVEPYFIAYHPEDMDAAIAETGHLLPVVVWGDGGCIRFSAAWTTLFEKWAAGGFVTLGLDALPGGLGMHTWQDQDALVDWVIAENERDGSPYFGKLDTSRIVAAGNSCGGVTALTVASEDHRLAAVFVLSGSSALGTTDVNIMGAITVPVGYIEGGLEDISRAAAESDYAALSDGIPAMIMARSTGDHLTISYGDQTIVAREAEISLNWMDLALYGTQEAYDALTSENVCTGCESGLWTLTSKNIETLLK